MIFYLQTLSLDHPFPSAVSADHLGFYRSMKQSVIAFSATSWTCMPDTLPREYTLLYNFQSLHFLAQQLYNTICDITHIFLPSFLSFIMKPFIFFTSEQLSRKLNFKLLMLNHHLHHDDVIDVYTVKTVIMCGLCVRKYIKEACHKK